MKCAHSQSQTRPPDLYNINAYTNFDGNPLIKLSFGNRNTDGRATGEWTDGHTDGHTDNQRDTITPRNYLVADYNTVDSRYLDLVYLE